jgi:hypothetical protein
MKRSKIEMFSSLTYRHNSKTPNVNLLSILLASNDFRCPEDTFKKSVKYNEYIHSIIMEIGERLKFFKTPLAKKIKVKASMHDYFFCEFEFMRRARRDCTMKIRVKRSLCLDHENSIRLIHCCLLHSKQVSLVKMIFFHRK